MKKVWKPYSQSYREAVDYIRGRQNGTITSLKTPWAKVNEAGIDGFEWNSTIVVGARPGTGKTAWKDQLIRESFNLNPNEYHRVLKFEFEMLGRVTAAREFSSVLGKSYKQILSADGKIHDDEIKRCLEYSSNRKDLPIDVIESTCTVPDLKKIIIDYMETYSSTQKVLIPLDGGVIKEETVKKYTKTLITVDHSWLLQKHVAESSKLDTLYSFGEAITDLKKRYPIIFVILTQLNRTTESAERNENGKLGNYLTTEDIFGADALNQHAEMLIGIKRPHANSIELYGPHKIIISDPNTLAFHFLKVRNGEPSISFFKGEFDKMRIVEIPTPPSKAKYTGKS